MKHKLLTRDDFREGTFARDGNKCVFCGDPAQDAHHIMERRLFDDGGYYLNNGASVCGPHHIYCETTEISVEQVREAAGITAPVIPDHLYSDQEYDKWGNPCLANGTRLKGELFGDESVQKILKQGGKLDLFSNQVKYPRTHHLPWSPGINSDDRIIAPQAINDWEGQRVIVTEKMDGENTSMYRDYFHARSIDGRSHPSRNWAKGFWSQICGDIPEGWRICGENLFARHSIEYEELDSFFMGFSIWNENNICLDWDTTQEWFTLLNITPVPVLYDGIYNETLIKSLYNPKDWDTSEGYVVRLAKQITYGDFRTDVAKFVRKNHVQTTKHNWQMQQVVPNKMKR